MCWLQRRSTYEIVIAEGKIQLARNKGEQLPAGAVLDGRGRPTEDAAAFYADPPGAILPFGGHKGSGLSFFCELIAGALTGGHTSNPASPTAGRLVNNMVSVAFDASAFGEGALASQAIAESLSLGCVLTGLGIDCKQGCGFTTGEPH